VEARRTDFSGIMLEETAFVACDLEGADFRGSGLGPQDLRGCNLKDVRFKRKQD
jgi:uncharacterized protein YjbI with pentapeptide repeats